MKTSENASPSAPRRLRAVAAATALAALLCASLSVAPSLVPAASAQDEQPPAAETIATYASDCVTPKTVFFLGEKICAIVENSPLHEDGWAQRRFQWAAPSHETGRHSDILSQTDKDGFIIPSSGPLAQPGRWSVRSIDQESGVRTIAYFTVRHPRAFVTDLLIHKWGPKDILPGTRVRYVVTVENNGPEVAERVEFNDIVPRGMTFYVAKQASGGFFTCKLAERGTAGSSTCYTEAMKPGESAEFHFYYIVDSDLREDFISVGYAEVTNLVEELNKFDNFAEHTAIYSIEAGDDTGTGDIEQP
jgi:uncharacterized repeat protein (TIGR01451 family)